MKKLQVIDLNVGNLRVNFFKYRLRISKIKKVFLFLNE